MTHSKPIYLRLPLATIEALDRAAEEVGCTRSELIQAAIADVTGLPHPAARPPRDLARAERLAAVEARLAHWLESVGPRGASGYSLALMTGTHWRDVRDVMRGLVSGGRASRSRRGLYVWVAR